MNVIAGASVSVIVSVIVNVGPDRERAQERELQRAKTKHRVERVIVGVRRRGIFFKEMNSGEIENECL